MSNPKKLHVEYATKEDMETARESSKEQPVARKTEPLSDSWQQDWNRDEKTNTKVRSARFLDHWNIFNLMRHIYILGDCGERVGFR